MRLKNILLYVAILTLVSSCSVVKQNGYYQSRKYNPKHKDLFTKFKKSKQHAKKENHEIEYTSRSIKTQPTYLENIDFQTVRDSNIGLASAAMSPVVLSKKSSFKINKKENFSLSRTEHNTALSERSAPHFNEPNKNSQTLVFYLLLLTAAALMVWLISVAGFHILAYVIGALALVGILIHYFTSSKSETRSPQNDDQVEKADPNKLRIGRALLIFAFSLIPLVFLFVVLDLAGVGGILALISVVAAIVGVLFYPNDSTVALLKSTGLVFLDIALNILVILGGLIILGY